MDANDPYNLNALQQAIDASIERGKAMLAARAEVAAMFEACTADLKRHVWELRKLKLEVFATIENLRTKREAEREADAEEQDTWWREGGRGEPPPYIPN